MLSVVVVFPHEWFQNQNARLVGFFSIAYFRNSNVGVVIRKSRGVGSQVLEIFEIFSMMVIWGVFVLTIPTTATWTTSKHTKINLTNLLEHTSYRFFAPTSTQDEDFVYKIAKYTKQNIYWMIIMCIYSLPVLWTRTWTQTHIHIHTRPRARSLSGTCLYCSLAMCINMPKTLAFCVPNGMASR